MKHDLVLTGINARGCARDAAAGGVGNVAAQAERAHEGDINVAELGDAGAGEL